MPSPKTPNLRYAILLETGDTIIFDSEKVLRGRVPSRFIIVRRVDAKRCHIRSNPSKRHVLIFFLASTPLPLTRRSKGESSRRDGRTNRFRRKFRSFRFPSFRSFRAPFSFLFPFNAANSSSNARKRRYEFAIGGATRRVRVESDHL